MMMIAKGLSSPERLGHRRATGNMKAAVAALLIRLVIR